MTSLLPDLRFFHAKTDEKAEQRGQSADKEHGAPAPARKNQVGTNRGQQIAQSIALLQDSGKQSSQPRRNFFHGERCADAPLAAHADAEQSAQNEKRGEAVREAGEHFDHGIEDEVDHQRQAAAVAIGHQSEDEGADGTKDESQRNGKRDLFVGPVKLLGDGGQRKNNEKKVEGIERPSQKTGENGWAAVAFAGGKAIASVAREGVRCDGSAGAIRIFSSFADGDYYKRIGRRGLLRNHHRPASFTVDAGDDDSASNYRGQCGEIRHVRSSPWRMTSSPSSRNFLCSPRGQRHRLFPARGQLEQAAARCLVGAGHGSAR